MGVVYFFTFPFHPIRSLLSNFSLANFMVQKRKIRFAGMELKRWSKSGNRYIDTFGLANFVRHSRMVGFVWHTGRYYKYRGGNISWIRWRKNNKKAYFIISFGTWPWPLDQPASVNVFTDNQRPGRTPPRWRHALIPRIEGIFHQIW